MENLHKKENLYKHIATFFLLPSVVLMGVVIFEFYSKSRIPQQYNMAIGIGASLSFWAFLLFTFLSKTITNKKVYLALEEAVKKNKLTLNKELDLYEGQDSFFKYSHYIENPDGSYNFIFKKYSEVLKI